VLEQRGAAHADEGHTDLVAGQPQRALQVDRVSGVDGVGGVELHGRLAAAVVLALGILCR
jgi:hypothetical protein